MIDPRVMIVLLGIDPEMLSQIETQHRVDIIQQERRKYDTLKRDDALKRDGSINDNTLGDMPKPLPRSR